jgi:four helix bundle protein
MSNDNFKRQLIRRAYSYGLDIIKFIEGLNKQDFIVQIIAKQLLRSATSIGANIIEAQAASSKRDFINFLTYALKSANESKFWLGLLRDSGKAKAEIVNPLLKETEEISKILGASIPTLKGKNKF